MATRQQKRGPKLARKRGRKPTDWGPKFLRKLGLCGIIGVAARHAQISRTAVYQRRDNDPVFAVLMAAALEDADDRLEQVARARAAKKSDKLMEFLLKSRRYKNASTVEHLHHGQVTASITHDLAERLGPYERVLQTFLGSGGALRSDGAVQSVDSAPANAEAGIVSPA